MSQAEDDLKAFLMQYGVDECTIGSNEAGDIVLIAPAGTPEDPDADAYFIEDLQGSLTFPIAE